MLFITNPTNLQAKEAFVAEAKPQQPIGKIYIYHELKFDYLKEHLG